MRKKYDHYFLLRRWGDIYFLIDNRVGQQKKEYLLKGNFHEKRSILKPCEQLLNTNEGEAVGFRVFVKRLV